MLSEPRLYGLVAEFDGPDSLIEAAARVREAGYRRTDAFSPFPVHGLAEAIGLRKTRVPMIVLLGGITGGITGYLLQYLTSVYLYPMNVAGRPIFSWVPSVPIVFELTVLFA